MTPAGKKKTKTAGKRTAKKKSAKKASAKKAARKVSKKNPVAQGPGAELFEKIVSRLTREHRQVTPGPMMSSPGVRWQGRVFAFFYREQMVFRLGRDFDPGAAGVRDWKPLNPFKNKPPLPGWFVLPLSEKSRWDRLAERALEHMRAS